MKIKYFMLEKGHYLENVRYLVKNRSSTMVAQTAQSASIISS